jgi:hypothetical protein
MDYYGKVFEKTVAEMNNSNDYYVLAEQIEVNTNNYW